MGLFRRVLSFNFFNSHLTIETSFLDTCHQIFKVIQAPIRKCIYNTTLRRFEASKQVETIYYAAMSEKTPSSKPKHDCLSIKSVHSSEEDTPRLTPIPSHISNTHDAPMLELNSYTELPDEVYDRLSPSRKVVIVTLLSFCSLLVPMSSTTVFAAVPEVATTYHSTGAIINLSNALYMGFMGLSPMFWGPLAQVYGRKPVCSIPPTRVRQ